MRFEHLALDDVERLYTEQYERWRVSHGPVITFARNLLVAFTPPVRPMAEATVALISTGGVHLVSQPAYDMSARSGDHTIRFIPKDAAVEDVRFTHDHYDHGAADQDPNCMFPLQHLRAFESAGIIGSAARTHVGASGWIPQPAEFLATAVPAIAERFRADGVDVALLTGG
jgi:D-proline reductase (dithiol) PrdB